jgi:hypothetical protein
MRHVTGIGLAVVMIFAMFFVGAWGYRRLLPLSASAALTAQVGSLLSHQGVLAAVAAVAATGLAAGILAVWPRISPLAAGLPGLLLIAWTVLYVVSVRRAVELIPLRSLSFGVGWEGMLFGGVLGGAGLAMIVPMFVPSRWRRPVTAPDPEIAEANEFVADLMEKKEPGGGARALSQAASGPLARDASRPLPPAASRPPRATSGLRPSRPEPPRASGSAPDL